MKLQNICNKLHFNALKEPGTLVECIDDKRGESPLLTKGTCYEVIKGIYTWSGFLHIKGDLCFLSEKFKRIS